MPKLPFLDWIILEYGDDRFRTLKPSPVALNTNQPRVIEMFDIHVLSLTSYTPILHPNEYLPYYGDLLP